MTKFLRTNRKLYGITCMVIALCLLLTSTAFGQGKDSKGKDFWLTFPTNYNNSGSILFYISGDQSTTGTVSVPGLGFSQNFSVTPGQITTISLPSSVALSNPSAIENKGIHVTALKEVTVYGMNLIQYTSDGYLGLPTDALGLEYLVMSYGGGVGGQIGIVASANATSVTFNLKGSSGSYAANTPYTITLNQGQTFYLQTHEDFTGSIITSNQPIAVFSGNQCTNVPPNSSACDHIVEQIPPTDGMGKNFITVPLKTRNGDTYRFLAGANNTVVSVNGAVVATLNKGQFYERIYNIPLNITASQPILVAQYSNGSSYDGANADPFMMLISPFEQFLGAYTISTPSSGMAYNFVNVVAPNAAVGTIKLDGVTIPAAQFTAVGSTGYSGAQVNLSIGAHNLTSGGLPFGAFVYGFNNYDSYGYPAGSSYSPIATVSQLTLNPETQNGSVGSQTCVAATVLDQYNNPVEGVRVDFSISGANPQSSGFATTDANGVASFCYTGINVGTDNIKASIGTLTDNGSITWSCTSPSVFTVTGGGSYCAGGSGVAIGLSESQAGVSYQLKNGSSNVGAPVPGTGGALDFGLQTALGTYTVVGNLTAGCFSEMSNSVSVSINNEPPTAVCKNITVSLNSGKVASVAAADINNGSYDNCGPVTISISSGKTSYDCSDIGQTFPVVLLVTDGQGNTATCTAQVTVADPDKYCNTPPTAVCRTVTVSADANCQGSAAANAFDGGSTDADGDALTFSVSPAGPYPLGTTNVILTVTDARGASSTCTTTITVEDKTPPTITCPESIAVNNDPDKCGAVVTYNMGSGSAMTNAVQTITLQGSIGSTKINVAFNPQKNVYYLARGGSSNLPIETFSTSGNLLYTTAVSGHDWRGLWWNPAASQLEGNPCSTCASNGIRKQDLDVNGYALGTGTNILPVGQPDFQSKGDYDYDANEIIYYNNGAIHRYSHANGAFVGSYTISGLPVNTSNLMPHFVAYTGVQGKEVIVYDLNSERVYFINKATGQYSGSCQLPSIASSINPYWGIGYTNGQIFLNDGYSATTYGFRIVTSGGGAATDNCNGAVTITQTAGLPSGSLFPIGTTTNTFEATDAAGNKSTCSFDVTVTDVQNPTVMTKNITVQLDAQGQATITASEVNNGSTDNCSIPVDGYSLNKTSFDCSNVGANEVILTVTDANGNSATGTAIVTVKDEVAPSVVTQDITIQLDANGVATITPAQINNGSTDNCSIPENGYSLSKTAFDCTNVGSNTVILTVTDASGNSASATATVTVQDVTPPTVITQDITIQLDASGNASITAEQVNNGSSDVCGISTMSLDKTSFDCSNVGTPVSVLLTVTDVNGNENTGTATVTVKDEVAPTVLTQNITVQLDAQGTATITPAQVNNGSSDACGIASISLDKTTFDCSNVGSNQVTLTVTDAHNNVNTATATVTVEDKIAPVVVTRTVTVHLDAQGNGSISEDEVNNGSHDACGGLTFDTDRTSFDCSDVSAPVSVTLTVTDANGNSATGTALVTVMDNIAPTVKARPVTITLVNGTATLTPQVVDDGSWDACGIQSMTLNKTSFDCTEIGPHEVTLTVVDNHGNQASATATVTVVGVIPSPVITVSRTNTTYTGPGMEKTIFLGYGAQSLNLAASDAAVPAATAYSWSPASYLSTASGATTTYTPDASQAGDNVLSVLATNQYGCTATAVVTISVVDARCGGDLTKINMCHVAGTDATHVKTICIDGSSVADHLKKGCRIGACPESHMVRSDDGAEMTIKGFALKAMPNPSTSYFTLKVETSNLTDRIMMRVMDVKGRLMEVQQNVQPNQTLRIGEHYRPGIYFIEVVQGAERTQTKLIKMGH